jgi:hypothetical protein
MLLKWLPFGVLLFADITWQENNIRMEKASAHSRSGEAIKILSLTI